MTSAIDPEARRSTIRRAKEFNRAHPMVLPALIGIALYVLLGFFLWRFIGPVTPTQNRGFAQLMAQIAGGLALLFGLYFTWLRVEISQRTLETQQDQQVTERFTRAIEQLGATHDKDQKPKLEIRLGGIYALERIAKDSPHRDYGTILSVLTAYVRENAPLLSAEPTEPPNKPKAPVQPGIHADKLLTPAPHEKLRADIQAALDVLGRREEEQLPKEHHMRLGLQNTDLSHANLADGNFSQARLYGAHLSQAILLSVDLSEAVLTNANFTRSYLGAANLSKADLRGANFSQANLWNADLSGADLSQANLWNASLMDIDLSEANLNAANLSTTDLSGTTLSKANLNAANLSGADLFEAILREADLSEANLVGASLMVADLSKANLSEVNLSGADLSGANLSLAQELTQKQLEQALGDADTQLPPPLSRPASWADRTYEAQAGE